MAKQNDSLRVVEGPDRVHWETGMSLVVPVVTL
jgi:hypothetical protein